MLRGQRFSSAVQTVPLSQVLVFYLEAQTQLTALERCSTFCWAQPWFDGNHRAGEQWLLPGCKDYTPAHQQRYLHCLESNEGKRRWLSQLHTYQHMGMGPGLAQMEILALNSRRVLQVVLHTRALFRNVVLKSLFGFVEIFYFSPSVVSF